MTLPLAPTSISVNQINLELGFTGTATAPINDAPYRTLAGLPTSASQISWSDFYGKTASFTTVGTCQPTAGGWYMGCTTACGVNYYLIAAPSNGGYVSGCFRCWGPNPCVPNPCMCVQLRVFAPNTSGSPLGCNPTASYDGYCITKFIQTCPGFNPCAPLPAGCTFCYPMHNAINGLTLSGFSDWYFPAATEIQTLYCNTDRSWACGSTMKSTGNQFTANVPQAINAPAAGSPGCWPYLGYVTWGGPTPCIPAPGAGYLNGLSNCNNGWNPAGPASPAVSFTSMCVPPTFIPGGVASLTVDARSVLSTTFAGGQPQGMYNATPANPCIYLGLLQIPFLNRFQCANCAMPFPGVANPAPGVFPTGTGWAVTPIVTCALTRAVRRVAI